MIDKGENDGVFVGQLVFDVSGLMGQVVEVMFYIVWVLLFIDIIYSILVQVNCNGLCVIVVGIGNFECLELCYVVDIVDIKEGDLLVSFGLG